MGNSRNLANLLGTGSTIATAKIADDAITAAKIADNAIGSAAVDLTANYAFTGTVSGTNGMTLLTSLNETSDTDYNSDTTIFNFDSHTSTYGVFFFEFSVYLTGNGNCHLYLATADASTTRLNMRVVGRGFIDNSSVATPITGSANITDLHLMPQGQTFLICVKATYTTAKEVTILMMLVCRSCLIGTIQGKAK